MGNKGTTSDGLFTLEEVECLASCGTAPAIQVNDQQDREWPIRYHENQSIASVDSLMDALRQRAQEGGER